MFRSHSQLMPQPAVQDTQFLYISSYCPSHVLLRIKTIWSLRLCFKNCRRDSLWTYNVRARFTFNRSHHEFLHLVPSFLNNLNTFSTPLDAIYNNIMEFFLTYAQELSQEITTMLSKILCSKTFSKSIEDSMSNKNLNEEIFLNIKYIIMKKNILTI
mgnify:CR=1 FL=1